MKWRHKVKSTVANFGQSSAPCWYALMSQFKGEGGKKYDDDYNRRRSALETDHYNYMMSGPNKAKYPDYTGISDISYVSGQRDAFNPCTHKKTQYVCKCFGHILRVWDRPTWYQYAPALRLNTTGSPIESLRNHFHNDLLSARVRAWKTMQPRIEGEMQLMNFLLELADVRKLLTHALEILGQLRWCRFKYRLSKRRKCWVDPTLPVSNLGLEYNLAIAPLISDLSHMWTQLAEKVSDLQDQFINDGKELQTRYYDELLYENRSGSYGTQKNYYQWYGTEKKTLFHATLDFKYTYKRRSLLDFGKRYWNLNLTPEVVWNGLPFTFVLDYFLKIGDAIHFMAVDPNLNMETLEYGESLKSWQTSGTHVYRGKDKSILYVDGAESEHGGLVSGYESIIYNRYVATPQKIGAYAPKLTKGLKNKELFNLLALSRSAFS